MLQRNVTSSIPINFVASATIATIKAAIVAGGSITASDIVAIATAVNEFASHVHSVSDYAYRQFGNYAYTSTTVTTHNTAAPTGAVTHTTPIASGVEITAADVENLKSWINALRAAHTHSVTDNAIASISANGSTNGTSDQYTWDGVKRF